MEWHILLIRLIYKPTATLDKEGDSTGTITRTKLDLRFSTRAIAADVVSKDLATEKQWRKTAKEGWKVWIQTYSKLRIKSSTFVVGNISSKQNSEKNASFFVHKNVAFLSSLS